MKNKIDIDKNAFRTNKLWQIGISFGLTVGISVYILGFLLGAWLDEKFATGQVFTIIGVLLAIFSSFARLIHDFILLDKQSKQNKEK